MLQTENKIINFNIHTNFLIYLYVSMINNLASHVYTFPGNCTFSFI